MPPRFDRALEEERRAAVFAWLNEQVLRHGPALEFGLLQEGARFRGERQPVMHAQKGIYVPAASVVALSLKTSLQDNYGDRFDANGSLMYHMERSGPEGADNRGARRASTEQLPLVYLKQESRVPRAVFSAIYPVWIVGVDLDQQMLHVETSVQLPTSNYDATRASEPSARSFERELERRYAGRMIRTRLHQAAFRERVLAAYGARCAMCRLKERPLLDAAHIDRDSAPEGAPVVSNGIALCRIHHAAFDALLLAVEPDALRVKVLPRVLRDVDGPMLRHGLQDLHDRPLDLPSSHADQPDAERLRGHWDRFIESQSA